ncbi:hypothetical protein ACJX0J_016162 [Zea mays]
MFVTISLEEKENINGDSESDRIDKHSLDAQGGEKAKFIQGKHLRAYFIISISIDLNDICHDQYISLNIECFLFLDRSINLFSFTVVGASIEICFNYLIKIISLPSVGGRSKHTLAFYILSFLTHCFTSIAVIIVVSVLASCVQSYFRCFQIAILFSFFIHKFFFVFFLQIISKFFGVLMELTSLTINNKCLPITVKPLGYSSVFNMYPFIIHLKYWVEIKHIFQDNISN